MTVANVDVVTVSSTSRPRTRVVLAEDHPVYRRGLVRAIGERSDLELVGDVGDGAAGLEAIARLEPDVALLDIQMPELDGLDVVRALRADGRLTPVLLLSGSGDADGLYAALGAGASGYLLKTAGSDEICDAIAAVARGEVLFSPELHHALARDIQAREQAPERPFLSARERDVLRLTAAGRSVADIASELYLSRATVCSHLQNAYQKLGVSDRAAAVATALRLGLID